MKLNQLKPPQGATKKRKRVGRGSGSGHGKTACRGNKGWNARAGGGAPPGFEGGQMPLTRRLPKKGFHTLPRKGFTVINIKDLTRFSQGSVVDKETLMAAGLVTKSALVKLLGEGSINYPLTLKVHAFSTAAQKKIEAAGGKVEII